MQGYSDRDFLFSDPRSIVILREFDWFGESSFLAVNSQVGYH